MIDGHAGSGWEILPPMDQVSFRTYIRVCLCFPFGPDSSKTAALSCIQRALQRVSNSQPFLKGKIGVDQSSGKIYLKHQPESTLPLILRQHVNLPSYPSLQQAGFPPAAFVENVSRANDILIDTSDVVRVGCSFIEKGMLLWIDLNHATADGSCLDMLLERLPASTRAESSECKLSPMTVQPHDKILKGLKPDIGKDRPLSSSLESCPEYIKKSKWSRVSAKPISPLASRQQPKERLDISGRIFAFRIASLNELRNSLRLYEQDPSVHPSLHVTLAALSWAQITKARCMCRKPDTSDYKDSISKLMIPVNWRRRAFCEETESFFGNTTLLPITSSPMQELLVAADEPQRMSEISRTVKELINEVDESFVTRRLTVMDSVDPRSIYVNLDPGNGRDLSINTWRQYGADMRWGIPGILSSKPEAIRRVQDGFTDGNVLILPAPRNSEEIEVLVALRSDELACLSEAEGWRKWQTC